MIFQENVEKEFDMATVEEITKIMISSLNGKIIVYCFCAEGTEKATSEKLPKWMHDFYNIVPSFRCFFIEGRGRRRTGE